MSRQRPVTSEASGLPRARADAAAAGPVALDPMRFPLHGSRLIEASAGTGKTWTIAALYLRLVLGHGRCTGAADDIGFGRPLRPDEILVMTFTRAATRELSDRIRARLVEAARVFRGEAEPDPRDSLLPALLADHPAGPQREAAAWRLAAAAEGMDDAAVHTIDAWCQRMLREHAFDSGSLFDEELVADESALLLEAAQDYWRQQVYPLADDALDTALAAWPTVEALAQDVGALAAQPLPADAGEDTLGALIDRLLHDRQHALASLRTGWALRAELMGEWLDDQVEHHAAGWNRSKLQTGRYRAWLATLTAWAEGTLDVTVPDLKTGRTRLTPAGLREARKPGAPEPDLPTLFDEFAVLMDTLETLPAPSAALRAHAAVQVGRRLAQLKQQARSHGFADLLARLDAALAGPGGARLRERIVAQTPVALIDEFQDTSALQYRLFDRLFQIAENQRDTALLLIGDPKQSIYRFRGADIHSYLAARAATAGRHQVLDTNHRATAALVEAVNHCFGEAEARPGAGAFGYRATADEGTDDDAGDESPPNPLPFVPVRAHGRPERFVNGSGPIAALTLHSDLGPANGQADRKRFARRCADQIVAWLNDPACGFLRDDGQPFQRLRPADIAVLVRSGTEARAIRQALARRRVTSVYLSDRDSVFASDEARDLLRWLRAVAEPANVRRVRAALATGTVGLGLSELHLLAQDDDAFEARAQQLRELQASWRSQGVLAMLRRSLHELDLPARWLAQADGERRLTNVLHLAELLQAASRELDGEQALIRWLAEQVLQTGAGAGAGAGAASADEQIVRLESDADLVKVVTVHKSKGLEYPVVCLPFASSLRAAHAGNTPFVAWVDAAGAPQLTLDPDRAALARAEQDRLREDLRLFYVALTRARHAVWLGYGARTSGRSAATVNHRCAAGYLLTGPVVSEPAAQGAALQALADGCPHIRVCTDADAPDPARIDLPPPLLAQRNDEPALVAAPVYSARFDKRWTIASFSSLVRALSGPPGVAGPPLLPRPADDESDAPTLGDVAGAAAATGADAASAARAASPVGVPGWHHFERGALAGNFLHDQLEWLAGEDFALADNPQLAQRLRQRCERAGRADDADTLLLWLTRLCQTPLPGPEAPLAGLQQVLPEMEFWLPAERLPAATVDRLCRQHLLPGRARPALPERDLHGMLMGFADLVFEHGGRFWVLDYKSNHLGPDAAAYTDDALAQAMAEHRYDVQAALYGLALHRLLTSRLGAAYEPARHLGGAVYLFLRGIDGPARGVCLLPPSLPLLAALDALLDGDHAVTGAEDRA